MNKPLEICVELISSINATVRNQMPDLRTWIIAESGDELESSFKIMVAENDPPAFAQISVYSDIPTSATSERFLEAQTTSLDWSIKEVRIPDEEDITEILREENKLQKNRRNTS